MDSVACALPLRLGFDGEKQRIFDFILCVGICIGLGSWVFAEGSRKEREKGDVYERMVF